MIVTPPETDRLLGLLRAEPGFEHAELAGAPEPLTGGYWATMSLLRLTNVMPAAESLVLRVMPDPTLAAKEAVFQREIARMDFPVPAVRLTGGVDSGLGGAFLLMDHAPGRPPLAGLDGMAAFRRLPSLARHLPDLLGRVTAALHALDPAPVRAALVDADVAAPCDADAFLSLLAESADHLGRSDLHEAAVRLARNPPRAERLVIGHGDLHPFNLLVDGERWTLLDWTTALVADPAYDLAFTTLMLRHPPLAAPAALRPVIGAAGAGLARRFVAAYRRHGGTVPDRQTIDWYTGLHALRILTEFHGWRQDPDGPDRSLHPWTAVAPVAALALGRATGMAALRS
ncbi:MAG TPA: phosphotransferase [Acidimicrobiales bacterium]